MGHLYLCRNPAHVKQTLECTKTPYKIGSVTCEGVDVPKYKVGDTVLIKAKITRILDGNQVAPILVDVVTSPSSLSKVWIPEDTIVDKVIPEDPRDKVDYVVDAYGQQWYPNLNSTDTWELIDGDGDVTDASTWTDLVNGSSLEGFKKVVIE